VCNKLRVNLCVELIFFVLVSSEIEIFDSNLVGILWNAATASTVLFKC